MDFRENPSESEQPRTTQTGPPAVREQCLTVKQAGCERAASCPG